MNKKIATGSLLVAALITLLPLTSVVVYSQVRTGDTALCGDGDTSIWSQDDSTECLGVYRWSAAPVGDDDQASIWMTDEYGNPQNDFPPDSDVYIRGVGFNLISVITVNITRPDTTVETFYNSSDSEGNFTHIYDLDGLEGEYTVNATDGSNSAQATFTDCPEPLTYKDSSYNNRIAVFHHGDTVFAKVSSGSHQTKFVWRNTTGQIVQQSSTWLTISPFTDSYDIPSDAVVGTWTVTRWSRHGKPGSWKYKNVTRNFYVIESNKFIPYDSWVEENKPDENKGNDETLHARYDNNENNKERWCYLKFNLSSIPTDSTITNANFYLYPNKGDPEYRMLGVYYISYDSWNENDPNGIDWNNRPTPPGSQIDSTSVGYQIWAFWNLSTQVQSEINSGGDKILSMVLYFPTYHCDNHKDFYSTEEDDTSDYKGPYLVIDYESQYTLNITVVGNGTVTKNPDQATYAYDTVVALLPKPTVGWLFIGWSGPDASEIVDNKITMTKNMEVTATFAEDQYTLAITIEDSGSVTKDPEQATYTYGILVTLTATPDGGWSFDSWSGDLIGSTNPDAITMDGNKDVTATFTQDHYTLTTSMNGTGSGTLEVIPVGPYHYNDVVTLWANASVGSVFTGWYEDLTGTATPETLTINGNMAITAEFTLNEYTLTINTVGSGTVTKVPEQTTYHYGDNVQLTANAEDGWAFSDWSGDLVSTDNPDTITIDGNNVVTATFTQDQYTLDITIIGSGSVTKDPDQTTYTYGTVVTLTAIPDNGWSFDSWSGDLTGNDNPETIDMTGDKTVIATFTQNTYTLNITVIGNGYVDADPAGPYTYETLVTLTAVSDLEWAFSHWNGDLTGDNNPETINMTSNKEVTATFTEDEYTLTIVVEGNGTVAKYPDQSAYTYGTIVELIANADLGWTFDHWSGNLTGNDNPTSIIMDGNKTVKAHFTEDRYILTITIDGEGSVTRNPDQRTYAYGTLVELTAIANPGWTFSHWTGDINSNANPETINMTENKTVTVHFTEEDDDISPTIEIVTPKNAIHVFDRAILPFPFPIIVRGVTIEVDASDNDSGVERVEFYIDGKLQGNDTSSPYTWIWMGDRPRKHIIKATAYDNAGNSAYQEITVWKWKFHPGLVAFLLLIAALKNKRG